MVPGAGKGKPAVAMDTDEECTARPVTKASLAKMRPVTILPPPPQLNFFFNINKTNWFAREDTDGGAPSAL